MPKSLLKLQAILKETRYWCFPVNFAKFLKTPLYGTPVSNLWCKEVLIRKPFVLCKLFVSSTINSMKSFFIHLIFLFSYIYISLYIYIYIYIYIIFQNFFIFFINSLYIYLSNYFFCNFLVNFMRSLIGIALISKCFIPHCDIVLGFLTFLTSSTSNQS